MTYGKLFYDNETDRIKVNWEDGSYSDGFHCGEVIDVYIPVKGIWEPYRIEYDTEWYFFGFGPIPVDTKIRINK